MSIVITAKDVKTFCGNPVDHIKVRTYMRDIRDIYGSVILHLDENHLNAWIEKHGDHKVSLLTIVESTVAAYCDEVWLIRQIGAATCLKNRYRSTPYDEMFF